MKYIICLFLSFPLFFSAKGQEILNYNNLGNYYLYNNKLYDVRSGKSLLPNIAFPGQVKYFQSSKSVAYQDGSKFVFIDLNGKYLGTSDFPWDGVISADWRKATFESNGDIWTVDIDAKTGKSLNKKQLTQLGTFEGNLNLFNWYGNGQILGRQFGEGLYTLNTQTSAIAESKFGWVTPFLDWNFYITREKANVVSPSHRFIYFPGRFTRNGGNNGDDEVFDMKTLSSKKINFGKNPSVGNYSEFSITWVADSIAIIYLQKSDFGYQIGNDKFYWLNLATGDISAPFSPPNNFYLEWHKENETSDRSTGWNSLRGETSRSISPGYSYMLVPYKGEGRDGFSVKFALYDLKNTFNVSYLNFDLPQWGQFSNNYEWVNDSSFIYSNTTNVMEQGTYLFNVVTKEKKKITSYLPKKAIVLDKANRVLLIANEFLYSMDKNGNNFKQISQEPSPYRWLQNFLDPISKPIPEFIIRKFPFSSNKSQEIVDKFMAQNKKQPGMMETPSGLQYKIITPGSGSTTPTANSEVTIKSLFKLDDGKVIAPEITQTYPISKLLKGLGEGLMLMKKGGKMIMYIPPKLGYGVAGAGDHIRPYDILVCEVELLDFK